MNASDSNVELAKRLANVAIKRLESQLKVPHGFVMSLSSDGPDWDFIVKLALFAEATLTTFLVQHSETLEFDTVSRWTQSQRLQTARKLGMLDKDDYFVLLTLAEIRNPFTHRLENVHRSLGDYSWSLTPERRTTIFDRIKKVWPLDAEHEGNLASADMLPGLLKNGLLFAVFSTLVRFSSEEEGRQREGRHEAWRQSMAGKHGVELPERTTWYLDDRLMVMDLCSRKKKPRQ